MAKFASHQPKVAEVMAVYNGAQWVYQQLESIVEQNVPVTIYISFDSSIDQSEAICKSFAEKYQNIFLLPNVGKFGGAAKNFFRLIRDVDFSDFDYLAYADQDDIWFKDKLIRAINKLLTTNSDGYSSNVLAFWPNGKRVLIDKSQPIRDWDYLFEAAGPGCTYVIKAGMAMQMKQLIVANWSSANQIELHDWFTYAYARANGYKWFIDNHPSMLYRQHASNQVGVNKGFKAFYYRARKVLGDSGFSQSYLIAKLIGKSDCDFVKKCLNFKRSGFITLALNADKCRRKPSERVLFFMACVYMSIFNQR